VVAAAAARVLEAPLDVIVARKVGAPFNPELALGAVGPDGEVMWHPDLLRRLDIRPEELEEEVARQRERMEELTRTFRAGKGSLDLAGKQVIIVDDGIATGLTALAAARYVRKAAPAGFMVAAPVAAPDTEWWLQREGVPTFFLQVPEDFWAVGQFYEDFRQVEDEEVIALLAEFPASRPADGRSAASP